MVYTERELKEILYKLEISGNELYHYFYSNIYRIQMSAYGYFLG